MRMDRSGEDPLAPVCDHLGAGGKTCGAAFVPSGQALRAIGNAPASGGAPVAATIGGIAMLLWPFAACADMIRAAGRRQPMQRTMPVLTEKSAPL
ncbi:hypothetical protein [Sphingomonas metalli]|nr:hypothetical protein [Sphingomonas metalli]